MSQGTGRPQSAAASRSGNGINTQLPNTVEDDQVQGFLSSSPQSPAALSQQMSALESKILSQLHSERMGSQSFLKEEFKKMLSMQEQMQVASSQKQEQNKFMENLTVEVQQMRREIANYNVRWEHVEQNWKAQMDAVHDVLDTKVNVKPFEDLKYSVASLTKGTLAPNVQDHPTLPNIHYHPAGAGAGGGGGGDSSWNTEQTELRFAQMMQRQGEFMENQLQKERSRVQELLKARDEIKENCNSVCRLYFEMQGGWKKDHTEIMEDAAKKLEERNRDMMQMLKKELRNDQDQYLNMLMNTLENTKSNLKGYLQESLDASKQTQQELNNGQEQFFSSMKGTRDKEYKEIKEFFDKFSSSMKGSQDEQFNEFKKLSDQFFTSMKDSRDTQEKLAGDQSLQQERFVNLLQESRNLDYDQFKELLAKCEASRDQESQASLRAVQMLVSDQKQFLQHMTESRKNEHSGLKLEQEASLKSLQESWEKQQKEWTRILQESCDTAHQELKNGQEGFLKLSGESQSKERQRVMELIDNSAKMLKHFQQDMKDTMQQESMNHNKEVQDSLKKERSSLVEELKKALTDRDNAISKLESDLGKEMKEIQGQHQKNIDSWGQKISSEVQVMANEMRSMPNAVKSFDGRLESAWKDVETKMIALKDHIDNLDQEIGNNIEGTAKKLGCQMQQTVQGHMDNLSQEIEKQGKQMTGHIKHLTELLRVTETLGNLNQDLKGLPSRVDQSLRPMMTEIIETWKKELLDQQDSTKVTISQCQSKMKGFVDDCQIHLSQSLQDLLQAQNVFKKGLNDLAHRNETWAEETKSSMNNKHKDMVTNVSEVVDNYAQRWHEVMGYSKDEMSKLKTAVDTVNHKVSQQIVALGAESSGHTSRLEKEADNAIKRLDTLHEKLQAELKLGLSTFFEEYKRLAGPEMQTVKDELNKSFRNVREDIEKLANSDEIKEAKRGLNQSYDNVKGMIDKLRPDEEVKELRRLVVNLGSTVDTVNMHIQEPLNNLKKGGVAGFIATILTVVGVVFGRVPG